jgi:hypothetical protein
MATSAYHVWVAAGRRWDLAKPIAQLKAWAGRNGIRVLGTIGNEDHLQAGFPEDHTPFSFTAWPKPLPGYWVTAIDLENRNSLGGRILMRAREGALPWLKYINSAGRSYAYADAFRNGRPNPDQHVHLSIFSDELDTDIGDFTAVLEGEDMPTAREVVDELMSTRIAKIDPAPGISHDMTFKSLAQWLHKHLVDVKIDTHTRLRRLETGQQAMADVLDDLAPGVAEAVSEAVARVTAEDVAGQLEVTVRPEGG